MSLQRAMVMTFLCVLAGTATASGGPPAGTRSADLVKAEKLIRAEKWDEAVPVLESAAQSEPSNADVFNWLGYVERHRGNMDASFAHYEKALQLDPKHRGAHEYVGEAYLMVGNLEKAREHLATLQKLCGTRCEEYKDLKKDIEEYAAEHASTAP